MVIQKTIKGNSWRSDSPKRGILNEIKSDKTIVFYEEQEDGTKDSVDIEFVIRDGQYGEYAEEYLPATIVKEKHNVIDITAIVIDEQNQKGQWYLVDVKDNIGGEDVIFHLINQWKFAYMYLKNSVLNYLDEVEFDEKIGVITRKFDSDRIIKVIEAKREEIKPNSVLAGTIAAAKKRKDNIRLEMEIKCLEEFLDGRFTYTDKTEDKNFGYFVIKEDTENKIKYYAKIRLQA